jgi:cytochrome c oxidase subunit 3
MWIFIISDAIVFASFLASYGFVRLAHSKWPHALEYFNVVYLAVMTFVLISSSATMASAVGASKVGDRKATLRFLFLTILGGCLFLGMQAYEWGHFIHKGASLVKNPSGVSAFGSFFFLITGFHGAHVFSGIVILLIQALRSVFNKFSAEAIEICGLYWHFVDLVWVFIFTLFYLM